MKEVMWVAVALVVVVALVVALPAICEPGPAPGGDMNNGAPEMQAPAAPPPTMVVTEKGVYILDGRKLIRFDLNSLKVVGVGDVPSYPPPPSPETPANP